MAKTLGYARVSTDQQDLTSQKARLQQLGAVVVFTEAASGSSLSGRGQLEACIRLLEAGDELLALNPDRLARDTGDLLTIGKLVVARGATLRIDDPKIIFDGSEIVGEILLTLFGMVGSIEKYFIRSRQRRGIEAAKARGAYKGRPPAIDRQTVLALLAEGLGPTAVARKLHIGRASVYRIIRDEVRIEPTA